VLSDVRTPVLAIWGNEDTWRSLEEGQAQVAELPDASLEIIEGAGHVPMDTNPERFVSLVDRWITGQILRGL
jgi:pimeloyl-ACP methyl ester carboxylesterase